MPDIHCAALYGWQIAVEFNNSNDSFTKRGTNTMTKAHESRDIHTYQTTSTMCYKQPVGNATLMQYKDG